MVKDYATKPANNGPKKSRKTLFISIIVILAAVSFPLFMFFYTYHKTKEVARYKSGSEHATHSDAAKKAAKNAASQKTTTNKDNSSAENLQQDPMQFDFYTLLPSETSSIQAQAADTHALSPLSNTTSKLQNTYMLQVASVKALQDAKKLRDQLTSLGFRSFIQKFSGKKNVWFRVMTGPYLSSTNAREIQNKLSDDGLESILLKLRS